MKKFIAFIILCVILLNSVSVLGISQGARGEMVEKLQTALNQHGYNVSVDGIYGQQTTNAVKRFQQDNGLAADGIAGPLTQSALGISAKPSNADTDVYLLARCVYAEARGESYVGKVAVAAIIINRVASPNFPNSISEVIYQPGAFDSVSDGQINLSPDEECIRAANDAFSGWDPTNGCLYYYNPATATNKWMLSKPILFVAGNHSFCR